jgi:hypothetical protein
MTTELLVLNSVTQAIQRRYPNLTTVQVTEIVSILLNEMGRRLSQGEELAFLRRSAENDVELTVIGLEQYVKADA